MERFSPSRSARLALFACLFSLAPLARAAEHPLRVHRNQRYLVQANGQPFFYLGDTAWELFHRLNREEADRYLEDRAAKGFTVIQAVILAELDGIHDGNAYGEKPLLENDPEKPNEKYFQHVDHIVEKAAKLGLTMGMLPTWGDKVFEKHVTPGPRIFTEKNAYSYGKYVANRYRDRPVIWILGGDRNPGTAQDYAIVRALARGIRDIDKRNLMTFHPRGPGRSSDYFHRDSWLSFNMYQSSHAAGDFDNGVFATHDYALKPAKPTLDGEPRYEALVAGFYFNNADNFVRFDDWDVRKGAYWSLLAGAAGHTYGNGNIWQMWAPNRKPVLGANIPWYESLNHPGAFQMGHLRRLFESRPFDRLVPDQSLIVRQGPGEAGFVRAARASDNAFAFVYSPQGEPVTINLAPFAGRDIRASWFDPRYGVAYHIHTGGSVGWLTFTPPTSGRGQDWVLVLDDDARKFPVPGAPPAKPK